MTTRVRLRLRIAIVVIACLLFQQMALAAFACTLTRMPAEPATMAEGCAAMGTEKAKEVPPLCEKHCAPDQVVTADHGALSVPALGLPPLAFSPVFSEPFAHVARAVDVPVDRSDPPPRLRYCSLLI